MMSDAGGATGDVEIELIRDPAELEPFVGEWRELAVARGNAFVTPEWFSAWRRHYESDAAPLVAVARGPSGRLAGILPLVVDRSGRSLTARFAASSLGDYFHPVAADEADLTLADAFGRALRSSSGEWKSIVLENVDEDASWWGALSEASGCGPSPLIDRRSSLPSVQLAGRSWEEYLGTRSRNLRSQLGRKRRALERDHAVSLRWVGADDDVAAGIAVLFRLHDMRWADRPGTSSLTSERARAFHADFAASARDRGWLRLCFLEVDSEPVAGWYGWRIGARFAYYQAGFDPAWRDASVGLLLFADTIRAAAEEGAYEYDMLLGGEEFKLRFADSARAVATVLIAPRLRPARLLASTEMRARNVSRRLPDFVRNPVKRRARSVLDRLPLARRR